jgi:spermidine synthase
VFQLDLARALWALAPAPFFWGASFPLAVAAVADEGQDPGALVGRLYAANTVGAILGAIGFGVVVVPWLGTQKAQQLLVAVAAYSTFLLAGPVVFGEGRRWVRSAGALTVLALVIALGRGISPVPPVLVAYGRYAPTYEEPFTLYVGEGRNSSIAVTELDNGVRNIHVGGKIVASTEPQDMRLQGMLGHLTGLLHEEPKSVLVVGFGAGVTAGTFVSYPSIERIVIVEIEPLVTRESAQYFEIENNRILSDPRVEVIFDDARHFLLTTDESFDLITSDPIHPWMKGAAALYSEEYFELAGEHLNPGGVITQWVPLYESTSEAVKSEVATFLTAFPNGTVWGNTYDSGGGYDVVLAAKKGELQIDVDDFVDRLLRPDHSLVSASLSLAGFPRALDLLSTYAGDADDLSGWMQDAAINRDRDLRLMYLAGLGLNEYAAGDIYGEILDYRSFPLELFVGDPGRLQVLRGLIDSR